MAKKKPVSKEEVESFLQRKAEEAKARSKTKLTAEDIARRAEERKEAKAATRAPNAKQKAISLGLGIALMVGAGAVAIGTVGATASFESQVKINETTFAQLEADKLALPKLSAEDEDGGYQAELDAMIATATQKGEEVAALQQEFASILVAANDEERTANGAASPAFLKSVEHRRTLAPYFVEQALLVEDAVAYAPGSANPVDTDKIDPRFPWFAPTTVKDGVVTYAPADTCTWDLVTITTTTTTGVFDATWLCQNEASDLYAWATAKWYAESEAFGQLSVGKTTLGERVGTES